MKISRKSFIKFCAAPLAALGILFVSMTVRGEESQYPVPPFPYLEKLFIKLPNPEKITLKLKKSKPITVDVYKLQITFLGMDSTGQAELKINYSERNNFDGEKGETPGYDNRSCYGKTFSLENYGKILYRSYLKCAGGMYTKDWKNGKVMKNIDQGSCHSSRYSSLANDCSEEPFVYFEDNVDYGIVPFKVNQTLGSREFSIKLIGASTEEAAIEILYTNERGRYGLAAKTASSPVEGKHYTKLPDRPKNIRLTLQKNKIEIINSYNVEIAFLGIDDKKHAKLEINYPGRKNFKGLKPVKLNRYPSWWRRDIKFSVGSPPDLSVPLTLYRAHRKCDGGTLLGREIIDLSDGYVDFKNFNRFYSQCIANGSFDTYYDEGLDFGVIPFFVNQTELTDDFGITLHNVTPEEASIEIFDNNKGDRYGPLPKI